MKQFIKLNPPKINKSLNKTSILLAILLSSINTRSYSDEMSASLGVSIVLENPDSIQIGNNIPLLDDFVEYFSNLAGLEKKPRIFYRSGIMTFYAVPECGNNSYPTLVVDPEFYQILISSGVTSLEYVIAHEIGHFMQYEASPPLRSAVCSREDVPVKTFEMMADTAAGWLIGKTYDGPAPQNLFFIISTLADYEFSNVLHHGTVSERSSAFGLGVHIPDVEGDIDMSYLVDNQDRFIDSIFVNPDNFDPSAPEDFFRNAVRDLYR